MVKKILFLFVLFFSSFLISQKVFAFTENFDNYTNGNLDGQGGWVYYISHLTVSGGTDKYVYQANNTATAYLFTASSTGIFETTFRYKISSSSASAMALTFQPRMSSSYNWVNFQVYDDSSNNPNTHKVNISASSTNEFIVSALTNDEWHTVTIRLDLYAFLYKVFIDDVDVTWGGSHLYGWDGGMQTVSQLARRDPWVEKWVLSSGASSKMWFDGLATNTYVEPEGEVQIVTEDGYNLQITYPMQDSYPNYNFLDNVGDFTIPFKFLYSLPDQASSSDYKFVVYEFTDKEYTDLDSVLTDTFLSTLDPDNNNVFGWSYNLDATSTHYMVFALYDTVNLTNKYALSISINSDELIMTTNQDLGFWGNLFKALFVPKITTLTKWDTLKTTIGQKAPWGYITLIQDEFNDSEYSGSHLTTGMEGTDADDIFGSFRSFFTTLMWLMFGTYLVLRIRHLVIT